MTSPPNQPTDEDRAAEDRPSTTISLEALVTLLQAENAMLRSRIFLQHTVPDGFHRIRHIGFLANRHRAAKLTLCRDLLAAPPPPDPEPPRRWQDRLRDLIGHDIDLCPGCGGRMLPHGTLRPCPPPRPPMWCDSS